MTTEELKSQIHLVLGQARGRVRIKDEAGHPTSLLMADAAAYDVASQVSSSDRAGEAVSEHLDLLRVLYSSLDEELKKVFWNTLTTAVWLGQYSPVVAHTIIELRALKRIPVPSMTDREFQPACEFWNAIRNALALQAPLFTDADLSAVEGKIRETHGKLPTVIDVRGVQRVAGKGMSLSTEMSATLATIQRVRYLRLKKQLLSSENPELNTDRRELMSRVSTLGFPTDVSTALDEVERKIRSAGTPLDFKGCMDLLRTIFERIFQESALKVATARGGGAPSGPSVRNFAPFKRYLLNEKMLSDDEAEVVQKVYNYVSNAGTHKLGSDVEQVRVTRNTVIEWSLMVVGRVQGLVATKT